MEKKEYLLLGLDAKRSNKPLNFIVNIPAYLISFKSKFAFGFLGKSLRRREVPML